MDSRDEGKVLRAEAIEELLLIALDDLSLEKQVKISSRLNAQEANKLTITLWQNADVFTWFAANMSKIFFKVITHRLNVSLSCRPVRQKRRQLTL